MKKLAAVTLSGLAGFTLAVLLLGITLRVRAGTSGGAATQNGDVNGDGMIGAPPRPQAAVQGRPHLGGEPDRIHGRVWSS